MKLKKQYRLDGRDNAAKGYVKEDRMANQRETDKLVEALEGFGYDNAEDYKFHLFGRLDDVHGWYLFGVSREDSPMECYVVLDDCLDPLDEPYDRVLNLGEVMEYGRTVGSGENIGTAIEAMQEWGVFMLPKQDESDALARWDFKVGEATAEWDTAQERWALVYTITYATTAGTEERAVCRIPAQCRTAEEATRAFDLALRPMLSAVGCGAEAEPQSLRRDGKSKGESVWVLTIYKDEQFFPEVHRTMKGAVDGAMNDIMEHMDDDEVDDYDYTAIRSELETQLFWEDEQKEVVYDIAHCIVAK